METPELQAARERGKMVAIIGRGVHRGEQFLGKITEVDGVVVIFQLPRAKYTGADARDDAGIPAGSKVVEGSADLSEFGGFGRRLTAR